MAEGLFQNMSEKALYVHGSSREERAAWQQEKPESGKHSVKRMADTDGAAFSDEKDKLSSDLIRT